MSYRVLMNSTCYFKTETIEESSEDQDESERITDDRKIVCL